MKNPAFRLPVTLSSAMLLLGILACNALVASQPASTPAPPVPTGTATALPVSAQVTLVSQALNETNQNPPFRINAQIPQLTGSDDPRVSAFNQRLNDLVNKEVDTWRDSFQQVIYISNGSSLDATYNLASQLGDLWSLKFDFNFYSDGAAHPGLYSITLNYDLGPVGALPAYRRQGLTRAAIIECLHRLKAYGMNRACVSTGVTNVPARQLYESIGFKVVNRYRDYTRRETNQVR